MKELLKSLKQDWLIWSMVPVWLASIIMHNIKIFQYYMGGMIVFLVGRIIVRRIRKIK
ncbi:unnamed protein product [marine sediment metagenome]|uniref:Uncharacterized protein n=1 Tax=marine sediment metagenome TaxID=412755 RepID=X0TP90_9ZZZZ